MSIGDDVYATKEFSRFARKAGLLDAKLLQKVGGHSFFAHGFAKNNKANVSARELKALKQLANVLTGFSDEQLRAAKAAGVLSEVSDGNDKQEG